MKKRTNLNLAFLVMLTAITLAFSAASAEAQEAAVKVFKVGDRVEVNTADFNSPDNWQKGTIKEIYYFEGKIFSYLVSVDSLGYAMQFRNYARVIRPLQTGDGEKTTNDKRQETQTNDARPTKDKPTNDEPLKDNAASVECSFDKLPEVKAAMQFSNSLVKSVLYERYASEANTGSLTSPGAIGVTFLNIQIGKPYTNTVTVVPGRGAQRRQDGAPPNATVYPFKAKYVVCKKYAKETVRTQYESDFVCFKDKTGNWNCPVDDVPKITYLK